MKKSRLSICSIYAVALSIGYGGTAQAQSMDYGSLQELFGEPITTAATGTPQRASEVAADMTIITADQIRQAGTRSIPQILGIYVPGIDILQTGVNSFDVGIRGYQQPFQPRLLVLLDGRQVFSDDYSRTSWDNLPINVDDIRQIEVVKGASSALFGSNATGGVINIITYSPVYDKNNVVTAGFGTQNEWTGDATVTQKLGEQSGVKLSAGGMNESTFDAPAGAGDSKPFVSPYQRYIRQNSIVQVSDSVSLNSELAYSEKNNQEAIFLYSIDPVKTTSYAAEGGLTWQSPVGLIKSTNYFNHNALAVNGGSIGNIAATNGLVVSQLEDQFKAGADHTFRLGVEYRYKYITGVSTPTPIAQTPELDENTFAASGTWLWQINDRLSWTNALRIDRNDMSETGILENGSFYPPAAYGQTYNTLAVNSGFVYKATDMDTFRATYGRGVQNPSLIMSGYNDAFPAGANTYLDVEGNPFLKPTIVQNYELDYDRKVPDIFSVLRLGVYYELNSDLVASDPATPVRVFNGGTFLLSHDINVGNSEGWGGEIELKGNHPSGFRWDGSYSYQTIRDASLVAQTLNYANSAPEHHLRLLLGYSTGPWEFDANGQYVTSTGMSRSTGPSSFSSVETAGYASLGGRIGYSVNDHVTIAASAVNINHGEFAANPYPEIERQALFTITGKF